MKRNAKSEMISPLVGLLIGINTIIGAGVFINIRVLAQAAQGFGFLGYVIAFLALLPVAYVISEFARVRPVAGGLYRYPREYVSPGVGFLSGWSYFLGKSTTAALIVHTIVLFFVEKGFLSSDVPIVFYDALVVIGIALANSLGVTIGGRVQWVFILLKVVPFAAVILGSTYFAAMCDGGVAPITTMGVDQFKALVPLALFALSGFESICAVGHLLEAPRKNAPFVIMGSAAIVAALAALFQFGLYLVLGAGLGSMPDPLHAFGRAVFGSDMLGHIINYSAFLSVVSGAYGYIVNNSWNIFALAQDDFFPGSRYLAHTNGLSIPLGGLAAETVVIIFLLSVTREQVPLQNMAVFATVFAYLLNVLAAFQAKREGKGQVSLKVSVMGLAICSYIMFLCFCNIRQYGLSFSFLSIFMLGILVALGKRGLKKGQEQPLI